MLTEGDIAASNVLPAYLASVEHGVGADELQRALGWTREALYAEGASVTGASTYRHLELMASRPGYLDFVFDAVGRHGAASLGLVGLFAKTCATLGEAFECHRRFQHLTNRSATYAIERHGERIALVEHRPDSSDGAQLMSEYATMVAFRLLRSISASPFVPCAVDLRRSRVDGDVIARLKSYYGVEPSFGRERAALWLDAGVLTQPVVSADAELMAYFQQVLRRASPESGDDELLGRVRLVIQDRLTRGTPTAAEVARSLGLGTRTLQRRLAERNRTFGRVLDETRRDLARRYLEDASLSLGEVAWLLGYAEQPAFHRAFRRWEGTTPASYRLRA